jgi:sterol desaturase/sphingolipid hydroxylase (fatty acid hydroxylase superfamily)
METLSADAIEELLHSDDAETRLLLEHKLSYQLWRTEELFTRFHRLYFLAVSFIALSALGVATLISFLWRTLPDYASQPVGVLIVVWSGIVVAVPCYFLFSAYRKRRQVFRLERQAFELEQVAFKELILKMKEMPNLILE